MWALVIYGMAFVTQAGVPPAVTFHPQDGEAECRAAEARVRAEHWGSEYVALCQHFPDGSSPRWPLSNPQWSDPPR